jgi:hypothetical protein
MYRRPTTMLRLRVAVCICVGLVLPFAAHASAATQVAAAHAATPIPIDPDTAPKGTADADVTVSWLTQSGSYELSVVNTSAIGYIDSFNWAPPTGLTLTSVTHAHGGQCSIVAGDIHCTTKLTPPKCTCQPGGELTVDFTATGNTPTFANGYWTYYGIVGSYLQIQTVTPVPYHIPSFLSSTAADLPLCAKGATSTKKHPCAKR